MATEAIDGAETLVTRHVLEFPYKRSVGLLIGRFLAALRDRRFLGVRMSDGRVLVPPAEYDPFTAESLTDLVDVGSAGVVTTWTWITAPRPQQPLQHPFAWALIRLDGADSALLHVVDAEHESRMRSGMRVVARWRDQRVGSLLDVECFVPETAA